MAFIHDLPHFIPQLIVDFPFVPLDDKTISACFSFINISYVALRWGEVSFLFVWRLWGFVIFSLCIAKWSCAGLISSSLWLSCTFMLMLLFMMEIYLRLSWAFFNSVFSHFLSRLSSNIYPYTLRFMSSVDMYFFSSSSLFAFSIEVSFNLNSIFFYNSFNCSISGSPFVFILKKTYLCFMILHIHKPSLSRTVIPVWLENFVQVYLLEHFLNWPWTFVHKMFK